MYVNIADPALLVDNKNCAFAKALRSQYAICLSSLAVRIKIAQQRVSDPPYTLGPCLQTRDAVYTDAQNLGMDPIKPVECGLVRWDLVRSDWRPGQREKHQHDITFPPVIAQPDGRSEVTLQADIHSRLTNLQDHCYLLSFFGVKLLSLCPTVLHPDLC